MASVEKICKEKRTEGPATILAIGTATPPNCFNQADFPDFYFRVTKSEHMTELKDKFRRMCENSMINKRYMHLTEDMLKKNPNIGKFEAPSLDARQNIVLPELPKLGKEAAIKAIEEWDQPKSKISHLIMCTTSGVDMPGADYQLAKLLDLNQSVCRFMLYLQGCYAGGTALRLAKDLAENNRGARVLVICAEITAFFFRGPSETHPDSLVGHALYDDGAGAVVVGADPIGSIEKPIFQLISVAQNIIPNSEGALEGHLTEAGLVFTLSKEVPRLISTKIDNIMREMFCPLGISDWNSIFWIVHPGGRAILDHIEAKLGLHEDKLATTRTILSEVGNLASSCVLFVLDEMRKKSKQEGHRTTGEGLDWGILAAFGAGLTVETIILHSVLLDN